MHKQYSGMLEIEVRGRGEQGREQGEGGVMIGRKGIEKLGCSHRDHRATGRSIGSIQGTEEGEVGT